MLFLPRAPELLIITSVGDDPPLLLVWRSARWRWMLQASHTLPLTLRDMCIGYITHHGIDVYADLRGAVVYLGPFNHPPEAL